MWRIVMVGLSLGACLSCQSMDWTSKQRALFQEQLTNDMAVATVALLVDIPESRLRELQNIQDNDIKHIDKKLLAHDAQGEAFEATLSNTDWLLACRSKLTMECLCYRKVRDDNNKVALLLLNKRYYSLVEKKWQEQQREQELALFWRECEFLDKDVSKGYCS